MVDETLRRDAPVSCFPFRYPVRDLTPDGTVIPRGTPVLAGCSAAGRDPAVYERLFGRFPGLGLAVAQDDLPRHAGFVGNSVRTLPVRLGV
ncbi:hypothetical protein [Streptomyces sp. NPDC006012]|uniref:hypothetical protein n=1 Tax=Streptomyces sp. NPDC006012 TaxID=3364739 RepID=UPI003689F90C